MSSVYLTGGSLKKQRYMSVNYVKKVYFPVDVLEYIWASLLKIAVEKVESFNKLC